MKSKIALKRIITSCETRNKRSSDQQERKFNKDLIKDLKKLFVILEEEERGYGKEKK